MTKRLPETPPAPAVTRPKFRNLRLPGEPAARGVGHDPERPRRARPPKPPADLEPAAAAHWRALAPAVAEGWRPEFSAGLSVLCRLLAAADAGPPPTAAYLSQLRLLLVEFGLTPRSHLARMRERSEPLAR